MFCGTVGSGGPRESPGEEVQRLAAGLNCTVGVRPPRWGLDSFGHPVGLTPVVTGMLYKQHVPWRSFGGLADGMLEQKEFILALIFFVNTQFF